MQKPIFENVMGRFFVFILMNSFEENGGGKSQSDAVCRGLVTSC